MKKIKTEIKITILILSVLVMVFIIGTFAYNGLKRIISDVSRSAKPEAKLLLLKKVLSDVSDAESNIKSYRLSHSSKYLSPFYRSVISVDRNLNALQVLVSDNEEEIVLMDRIMVLIDKKYALMNELLSLRPDENITKELTVVTKAFEEETRRSNLKLTEINSTRNREDPKIKKKSFLARMFGKKQTPEVVSDSVPNFEKALQESEKNKNIQRAVKGKIQKVNENHLKKIELLKQQEFLLNTRIESITYSVQILSDKIESLEEQLIINKTKNATTRAEEINMLVGIFCVASGLLLITVGIVIINYIRKKNAFERALRDAKEQAELTARSKEIFLANMSHEIRTPMNAIAGFTKELWHSNLNASQREQVEIVKRSTDHLIKIINDILDHSRLQAGKIKFEKINFNPYEVLTDAVRLIKPLSDNSKVDINYNAEITNDVVLNGDPGRLRQIILNLLGNSIKFTEKGTIEVGMKSQVVSDNEVALELIVADTGIGIPKNKIEEVFEEYKQADDGIFFKYGGTGLGLPITKKIVELQGGNMKIASEEGKGTKITITIPYEKNKVSEAKGENASVLDLDLLNGIRVLIADDDEYNRKLLYTILSKYKIQVQEAVNGKEVIDKVLHNSFDMILMDARMPEMSGIEACKKIRNLPDPKKSRIPIIALTAVTSVEKMNSCREAGMNDFLSKPFDEEELLQKIINLLGENDYSKQGKFEESEAALDDNAKAEKNYDLSDLVKISNGDGAFLKEMISTFIDSTADAVKEMEGALKNKKYNEIADQAHKIAPACRHMGAIKLLNLVKQMEYAQDRSEKEINALVEQTKEEVKIIIGQLEMKLKEEKRSS